MILKSCENAIRDTIFDGIEKFIYFWFYNPPTKLLQRLPEGLALAVSLPAPNPPNLVVGVSLAASMP